MSRDATEQLVGVGSCRLHAGFDQKRLASGSMQAPFQHTRRPSLDSIQVKHSDTGRTFLCIALFVVLYFNRLDVTQ